LIGGDQLLEEVDDALREEALRTAAVRVRSRSLARQ
jgi:hypothetical protein